MSRKLTKRAVIKCRGLENLPRKIYAQPWRLSNANANTNFRCVLDEVLSCSRSFSGGWWWWVGWIGKWVGEHSSRLVKNFFATLDDQPGQPEQPGQPGHAARQLASHFECFFGDSCLPKAVSSFSFTCWHFVSIALEDSFRPEKLQGVFPHLLLEVERKILCKYYVCIFHFIFNLPHFTFCFPSIRFAWSLFLAACYCC